MLVAHSPNQQQDDRTSRPNNSPPRPLVALYPVKAQHDEGDNKRGGNSPTSINTIQPFDEVRWSSLTNDYRSAAVAWLTKGTGIGAVLAMPLGPVGFVVGALIGCGVTLSLGLITDSLRIRKKKREAEIQGTRMDHLLRWISFVFGQYEQQSVQLFLYILQEFEAICAVADHNKTAQSLMKRLRDFLERTEVQNCAAEYWDLFIERWRDADPDEIATFQTVVHVCTTVFSKQKRWPDIYYRMSQCQNAPIVQDLFAQATRERKRITEKAMRDKDWVTYADVGNKRAEDLFRSDFQRKFGLKRWRSASDGGVSPTTFTSQPLPIFNKTARSVDHIPTTISPIIPSPPSEHSEPLSTSKPIDETRHKQRERHHTVDLHILHSQGSEKNDWLPMLAEKSAALRTSSDTVALRNGSICGGFGSASQHLSLKIPEKVPHLFFDRSVPVLPTSDERSDHGNNNKHEPDHNEDQPELAERGFPSESSSLYISIAGDDATKDLLMKKSISLHSRLDSADRGGYLPTLQSEESPVSTILSVRDLPIKTEDTGRTESQQRSHAQDDQTTNGGHVALSVAESQGLVSDLEPRRHRHQTNEGTARESVGPSGKSYSELSGSKRFSLTAAENKAAAKNVPIEPPSVPLAHTSEGGHPRSNSNVSSPPSNISVVSTPVEEEKRFFKSLQDLREFSPELKHKIPIGLYEFEFLDEIFPEMPLGKWEWVATRNDVRIYKQIVGVKGSDLVMVKGYVTFDNISIENVLYNIRDTVRRTQWDTTFDGFTLIESDVRGNEVVYNSIKAPWPVTDRDFLQWRRLVTDTETGVVKILHRSAEHPAKPEDHSGNMIRAESIISAYILTPKGPNSCELFLLTQTDVKGTIPRWLVNSTAAKAPFSWVENLRTACLELAKKRVTIPKYNPKPLYLNGVPVVPSR